MAALIKCWHIRKHDVGWNVYCSGGPIGRRWYRMARFDAFEDARAYVVVQVDMTMRLDRKLNRITQEITNVRFARSDMSVLPSLQVPLFDARLALVRQGTGGDQPPTAHRDRDF